MFWKIMCFLYHFGNPWSLITSGVAMNRSFEIEYLNYRIAFQFARQFIGKAGYPYVKLH